MKTKIYLLVTFTFLISIILFLLGLLLQNNSFYSTLFGSLIASIIMIAFAYIIFLEEQKKIDKINLNKQIQIISNLLHELDANLTIGQNYYSEYSNFVYKIQKNVNYPNPMDFFNNPSIHHNIKEIYFNERPFTTKLIQTTLLDFVIINIDFNNNKFKNILPALNLLKEVLEVYKFNMKISLEGVNDVSKEHSEKMIINAIGCNLKHSKQLIYRIMVVVKLINKINKNVNLYNYEYIKKQLES